VDPLEMKVQPHRNQPTLWAFLPLVCTFLFNLFFLRDVRVAKAHVATNVRHKAFASLHLAFHTFSCLKRED
jgi:hypothetical protein